ncbi:nuclear transport factor 2 family protein [Muricoccus aerilatus]|uniref:nuclear transport factor 2 family protein n=1 Tax=Muricoccus aerilatus TaxID=452982 RepID=UPI0005C17F58|nr:nuclear transport factor 2 family protein [Roseomonas aerilata]
MPDPIASLLTRNLHEVFEEADPARRRAGIAALFTEDAVFADSDGSRTGHDALDRFVEELLARSPGWVFQATGPAQGAQDAGRLAWGFGPPSEPPRVTGLDVILVRGGKIASLYTFLDPPAP